MSLLRQPASGSGATESATGTGRFDRFFKPGFIHRDLYVSQNIFADEMAVLFGSTWVYVAHESEIPEPGDFVTRTIGRRPVIVIRGDDGGVEVLLNRCPHRGATVCREKTGNATHFTCPYHAWSFETSGKCKSVPLRAGYAETTDDSNFDLLKAAAVDSHRGFIFAALRPVKPLLAHLAGAAGMIDQWVDRNPDFSLRVKNGVMTFDIQANWKCIYDNAADGYHVPFSHESMLRVLGKRYGDVDFAYYHGDFDESPLFVKDLGNGHTLLDQRPEMHADSAWRRQHVSPGREVLWQQLIESQGEDRALELLNSSTGSGMNLNVFPNLMIIGNQIQVLEPVTVNRTHVHWYSTTLDGAPAEVNAVRMRLQEDFPSFGEVDDAANFESCQYGMEAVPEMEWINIARHSDSGRGKVDEDDGHWREPVSSDLHARAYFKAWRDIMEASLVEAS